MEHRLRNGCNIGPFKTLPPGYTTYPPLPCLNPKNYIGNVNEGDVIWVQEYKLKEFYYSVLPQIQNRFILVVTDGDESFPTSYTNILPIYQLINDNRIIHIFAQNVSEYNPKISPIPIGLDFHSITSKPSGYFNEPKQSVENQQIALNNILSSLLPTYPKKRAATCRFSLVRSRVP